jgi:hypothetical protein
MYLNTDYILPAELTGYVRAGLGDQPINRFALAQWLPNRPIDDLEYRYTKGGEGLVEAATFRSYDAESGIGGRPGLTRVTGELPPISRKIRFGEYDRLRQRQDPNATIRIGLMDDAMRMARAVSARIELARGEALYKGKLQIDENGVVATVDFGRAAGHTVTAGTVWSDTTTSTPLVDMITWMTTYNAANGVNPGATLLSTRILGYLMNNVSLRGLLASNGVTPAIASRLQLESLLSAYGIPPFYVYDAQIKVSGSATRVIPDDRFLYLPAPGDPNDFESNDLGATLFGTTSESLEPEYGVEQGEEAGIVAGVYKTNDPVAFWTKAAAISLPVLANPDLTFCADVA